MQRLSANGKKIGRPVQTHCKNGHELAGDNVYELYDSKRNVNVRTCRTCLSERYERRYAADPGRYARNGKQWRDKNPHRVKRFAELHQFKRYNITEDDFNAILESQGGVCAICLRPETRRGRKRLCVDHDHETGVVRGLLCHQCNLGIGCFGDDIARLQFARMYLSTRTLGAPALLKRASGAGD